jgi:mycinamicin biosynthesis methyltransferase MycE-like protein/methyltransferase family protein
MSTGTQIVESVLRAACLPDAEAVARVTDIGPDAVAEVLLAEVASRAALLNGPSDKFVIQCDLGFGGGRLGYLLTVGDGAPSVEKGWDGIAAVTIRQDLGDLLRELFGPIGPYGATREISATEYVNSEYSPAIAAATWPIVGAMRQRPQDLSELAARFGSDKWGGRWYTPHYQKHFEPYRELPVKVLEIGIGGYDAIDAGGESLRMWKHYFRRGLIYGLDIFEKTGVEESRLQVVQGDQGDEAFLDSLGRELGPFDIIIDDGSHMSHHVLASFNALFPHVKPGGIYVVEDLATAYWPAWGGATDPSAQYKSIELIKNLLDGLHHSEQIRNGDAQPSMTESTVTAVHMYHNLALIEKGLNTEQGGPEWLKRYDHTGAYTEA